MQVNFRIGFFVRLSVNIIFAEKSARIEYCRYAKSMVE